MQEVNEPIYIFFDIDGVLRSEKEPKRQLNKDKIDGLLQLQRKYNAELILCSSWRHHWEDETDKLPQGFTTIKDYLQTKISKNVTPLPCYEPNKYKDTRAKDIAKFLGLDNELESGTIYTYVPEYKAPKFIIIDDMNVKDYIDCGLGKHLVITDSLYGLTPDNVEEADKILDGYVRSEENLQHKVFEWLQYTAPEEWRGELEQYTEMLQAGFRRELIMGVAGILSNSDKKLTFTGYYCPMCGGPVIGSDKDNFSCNCKYISSK